MSTVFTIGQKIKAVASFGWRLTEGAEYEVVDVIERLVTPHFTFPEYVVVLDDFGGRVSCHTHRFKAIE